MKVDDFQIDGEPLTQFSAPVPPAVTVAQVTSKAIEE